jgi:hypothetical protein
MRATYEITETIEADLPGDRAARIQRDAVQVRELAEVGFEGPAYELFEDQLLSATWPMLRGMLCEGKLIRIAQKWCKELGRPFWVHPDDFALLRSSSDARDEVLVEVVLRARKSFKRKALVEGGWNPDYKGSRGPSCLTSFFVNQCIWEFRRVYMVWAKDRFEWAEQHVLYDGSEEAAHGNPRLFAPLLEAGHISEPEAAVLSTNFHDILDEQPVLTQAVVRLTIEGYMDSEIAEELHLTHAAVRMRKTRFRNALYGAARERRIWIPEQLHTKAGIRRRSPRGAA